MDDVLEFFFEIYEYGTIDCCVRSDHYRDSLRTNYANITSCINPIC